ncbi:MAG: hypothetical protein RIS70_1391 [Planctomycetota bacterium]|jgi:hypothetical protein
MEFAGPGTGLTDVAIASKIDCTKGFAYAIPLGYNAITLRKGTAKSIEKLRKG